MLSQAQARIQFVAWLKEFNPALAAAAISHAETVTRTDEPFFFGSRAGLGQIPTASVETGGSFWEKITTGAMALGTTYLTLRAQRDAMKINIARAEQGLPPIDPATAAPVIRTQVDIDPALAQRLASNVGSGLNRALLIGGAVVVALVLFLNR